MCSLPSLFITSMSIPHLSLSVCKIFLGNRSVLLFLNVPVFLFVLSYYQQFLVPFSYIGSAFDQVLSIQPLCSENLFLLYQVYFFSGNITPDSKFGIFLFWKYDSSQIFVVVCKTGGWMGFKWIRWAYRDSENGNDASGEPAGLYLEWSQLLFTFHIQHNLLCRISKWYVQLLVIN